MERESKIVKCSVYFCIILLTVAIPTMELVAWLAALCKRGQSGLSNLTGAEIGGQLT